MSFSFWHLAFFACVSLAACGADSFGNDADSGTDAPSACPNEAGRYSVALSGAGCGDAKSAGACIQQSGCTATLTPLASGGLSGMPAIGSDGSLSGNITEGSANRSGCSGPAWNPATSTVIVDCGGMGTSQSCRATLTRVSAACN